MSLRKALYRNRDVYIGFLALILLGSLFISLLTAFTIQRPINGLLKITRNVQAGDEPVPVEHPATREFQELSDAIASMASTLKQRADYIQDFARSVSHEFKTPITSLRGTVELLQDHVDTMSREERDSFYAMLDHDAQRLEKLVRGLLELARADVAEPTQTVTPLEDVLAAVKGEFANESLSIVCDPELQLKIFMGADAAEAVFMNLVRNALESSATECEISVSRSDSYILVSIRDNGDGIAEVDQVRIFESFFTTKRDHGGTGLGLSIVRSLMHSVGGTLELANSGEDGTTFELRFPAA